MMTFRLPCAERDRPQSVNRTRTATVLFNWLKRTCEVFKRCMRKVSFLNRLESEGAATEKDDDGAKGACQSCRPAFTQRKGEHAGPNPRHYRRQRQDADGGGSTANLFEL